MWDRDELYSAYLESNFVLKLYEVYDQPKVHIYEEFRGGSLSDLIFKTFNYRKLSIQETCTIIYKITEALNYLHERNIVFRNLKPENIVFTREDDFSSLKLCNFEYAINLNSDIQFQPEIEDSYYSDNQDRLETIQRRMRNSEQDRKRPAGTVIFMAPEMLQEQRYDQGVDIWSLGIIFYLLLTNVHPLQYLTDFVKKTEIKDAVLEILQGSNPDNLIEFDSAFFDEINSEIEFLLKKMLKIDRKERISAAQILELQSILSSYYDEYWSQKSKYFFQNNIISIKI